MSERAQPILPWASSTTPYACASRRANQCSRGKLSLVDAGIRLALRKFLARDAADEPGVAGEFVVHTLEQISGGSLRPPPARERAAVDAGGH